MVKASAKVVELLVGRRWRHDAHDPGTICVHRMEEVTRYRFPQPTDANYQTALIYIPVQLLASSLDQFRRPGQSISLPRLNSIVDSDGAITQTAHALLRAMTLGEGDIYAEAAATWLAVHVLSRYGPNAGVQDNRNAGGLTDARLARVVEFMSVHFAQPLTLDRIAQEAHVSKFHFHPAFSAEDWSNTLPLSGRDQARCRPAHAADDRQVRHERRGSLRFRISVQLLCCIHPEVRRLAPCLPHAQRSQSHRFIFDKLLDAFDLLPASSRIARPDLIMWSCGPKLWFEAR